jgi:hypothetical protein
MKSIKKMLMIVGAIFISGTMAFAADGIKENRRSAEGSLAKERYHAATGYDFKKPVAPAALIFRTDEARGLKWYGIKGIYAYNKAAIKRYETAVILEENRVEKLKGDLKAARKDKRAEDAALIRKKLKKAKFDLFRDQMHLMIDKEALRYDYKLVIADQRQELAADRKDLCKAKAESRKDNEGKALATRRVSLKEREVEADKAAIANEKENLKADMAKIDQVLE